MITMLVWFGAAVLVIPAILTIIILGVMWRSWWLYPAWGWFVVPLGMPAISFWHFAALLTLISVVTTHIDTKEDERKESWAKVAAAYVVPIVMWFVLRLLK